MQHVALAHASVWRGRAALRSLLPASKRVPSPAGIPISATPLAVPGYSPQMGLGIQGGDFECSVSVYPGVCALRSALDGAQMCAVLAECQAVVVYSNGAFQPLAGSCVRWGRG